MSTPVVMPQMGESIAEGTVVRWIKKLGDRVDRDEPLFEISTDKVDAEIPSPAAGVLLDIKVHEGETVPVDSVVATIGEPGEMVVEADSGGTETAPAAAVREPGHSAPRAVEAPTRHAAQPARAVSPASAADRKKLRSSPLVRRIASDNDVDIAEIAGSGIGGRVTKHDILGFLTHRPERPKVPAQGTRSIPAYMPGENVEIKPLTIMRRKIAEHMVLSRQTSAHVHTVFHVDFTHVAALRAQHKAGYEKQGAKLTFMAFIAKAVAGALERFPIVNSALDGHNVVYKKDINIGVAVALESGLIVPVIRHANALNMVDLSKAILDVADRARAKQLKADEVHGGTFTITNPGSFGAQFGLPIINQPQAAILGVGTIEKRAVVVDDALAVRTMAYLALGFDHRIIDGALADEFMADIRKGIEAFDPSAM